MKLISWNVNGFRACLQKGFEDVFRQADASVFCIQETKMQEGQADFHPEGYFCYYHSAERKGYSGTAVFSRQEPLSIQRGMAGYEDSEGRVLTLEFPEFYLINCYVPNAQQELARIDYRLNFEMLLQKHLTGLAAVKPVIYCGDLNVAHEEIDLKHPAANRGHAGFSDQERNAMTSLLQAGFVDSFRFLYPDQTDTYSWWSYRFHAREHNAGWRIDYFLVSEAWKDHIQDSMIYSSVTGSDHCPVGLEISL